MNGPLVLIWFTSKQATSKQICTLFGLETLDLLHPQSKILQIYFVPAFYFTRLILKHLCKFCCVLSFLYPRSVYRDQCNQMLKLKLAQFFKSCPISDYRSYCFNKICFKKSSNILATFVRRFTAKNFQKLPNLVTLIGIQKHFLQQTRKSSFMARLVSNLLSSFVQDLEQEGKRNGQVDEVADFVLWSQCDQMFTLAVQYLTV